MFVYIEEGGCCCSQFHFKRWLHVRTGLETCTACMQRITTTNPLAVSRLQGNIPLANSCDGPELERERARQVARIHLFILVRFRVYFHGDGYSAASTQHTAAFAQGHGYAAHG